METEKIIIYQTDSGTPEIRITLENETLWLSQRLMAELFARDTDTIGLHIKNIYAEGELDEGATTEFFSVVQQEGKREVKRSVIHYNLDVILSVGYRVNSKRGTQFRIWANKVLKDYLVKGYAINERRLNEKTEQYEALKKTVRLVGKAAGNQHLSGDEASGLLKVITDYAYALDVLDKYDHRTLTLDGIHKGKAFVATYEEAMHAIQGLRNKFGGSRLFGNEKDESFKGSIAAIYQSFGGRICIQASRKKPPTFFTSS